jgi:hypothetical protein
MKPYGVEWRTPSNANWYTYVYEDMASRLFGSLRVAISLVEQGVTAESIIGVEGQQRVQEAINTADYGGCNVMLDFCRQKYMANPTVVAAATAATKEYGNVSSVVHP